MSAAALLDKSLAVVRRDLLTARRYRSVYPFQLLALAAEIAGLFYLARAVGAGFRPEGVPYFPFLVVGSGFLGLAVAGVQAFASSVQDAQVTGTFEILASGSTPAVVVVILNALSVLSGRLLMMAAYVAAGLVLAHAAVTWPGAAAFLLVLALSLLITVALGIIAAAAQIAFQKGSLVSWLVGTWMGVFSGVMFPIGVLPAPLQILALLFPLGPAIPAMRLALLAGAPLGQMTGPVLRLAAFGLVLLPASLGLFAWVLERARLRGTLSFY